LFELKSVCVVEKDLGCVQDTLGVLEKVCVFSELAEKAHQAGRSMSVPV